ncbi:MAG: hypothetical protein [Microviridae sp.]|nr:MAG: hypothetical protein [Microviridae sp.]
METQKTDKMEPATLGMIAATGGTILEQALADKNTKRQVDAQKELGRYNQDLALEMWDKTNYAAQRKQMEKAGLNVGLMYKGAGQGGTTAGGQAGTSVGLTGNQGMGMQLGLAAAQAKAGIELTQAQTKNVQADTAKKTGADTDLIRSSIENLKQSTNNAKVQEGIMKYEQEIKRVESEIAGTTQNEIISQIRNLTDKLGGEADSAAARGEIDQATKDTIKKQIEQNSVEQGLRIAGQKMGLKVSQQQIEVMSSQMMAMAREGAQNWQKLGMQERETWVKEQLLKQSETMTEFNTSTANQVKQWTSIVTDIFGAFKPNK